MLTFRKASALCYRIFDVADRIDLDRCRELISKGGGTDPHRISLKREGSEFIQLSSPPLSVSLAPQSVSVGGASVAVSLAARIFDHGAISVLVRVPLTAGHSMESLIPIADELYDSPAIDALAKAEVEKLRAAVLPSFEAPHLWEQHEEYTVLFVTEFDGAPTAKQVLDEPALPRVLLGESKQPNLSQAERDDVLTKHFSYTNTDLAVLEWNAAFIYEPSGSEDIVDLLEIANAQLLELRYYDAVLDKELTRVYDTIEKKRGGSIVYSPYKKLLRELMQNLIELSEFIERIENALKIVGDVYLARVYEAALAQLRVGRWTDQVSRKHRLLQQTYGLLKGEVDHDRTLALEAMVVVLIIFEIIQAMLQARH